MTRASCPVRRRCSSTRITELLTPLTCGRKDSATIATRTPSRCQYRLSIWLPTGIRHANSDAQGGWIMRFCLRVWAISALWLVMFGTGTAHADVPRTTDGSGVVVGSGGAPVELEIFCEPQCPHCAELDSSMATGLPPIWPAADSRSRIDGWRFSTRNI